MSVAITGRHLEREGAGVFFFHVTCTIIDNYLGQLLGTKEVWNNSHGLPKSINNFIIISGRQISNKDCINYPFACMLQDSVPLQVVGRLI
jgi:hypothetical protein